MNDSRIAAGRAAVVQAGADEKISAGSVTNLLQWLTDERYRDYLPQVIQHVESAEWRQLDDVFFTAIPFGTGGRRGRMYPIGSNAINERTIGESAQGLAEYVLSSAEAARPLACAIAYDTRHNSRVFAELCAEIMVAHGFRVYFLDQYRSTPQLSFLVRWRECSCGIMVTASHNPPSDNAVKVYWSSGVQVLPPHDERIIEQVQRVGQLKRVPFQEALRRQQVVACTHETDAAYQLAVLEQATPAGPRDVGIVYSPLHGVGTASVEPVLRRAGFQRVEIFGPHAEPNGDFPNVPGHVSNPENPRVFDAIIQRAKQTGADLVMVTDPDCDRLGCAAPLVDSPDSDWGTFNGNQIAALLCDYVLQRRKEGPGLAPEDYVLTTLVTTRMVRRIAESYGAAVVDDLLVGFKWICGEMDRLGPEHFLFGAEESHGYLAGQHVRDKDGAVACLLLAELAARLKTQGLTLHQKLQQLHQRHGRFSERLINVQMEGASGMQAMQDLMARLRHQPPASLGGLGVAALRDYLTQTLTLAGSNPRPLQGPKGDLLILDLELEGNYVAIRPSGTEPKVKYYLFAFTPPDELRQPEQDIQLLGQRLDVLAQEVAKL